MEHKMTITYWQDGEFWLGYLNAHPEYMIQGMTLEKLRDNLKDIYLDLHSGQIPCPR
ncbi:MAG: type II toxin-antitoxin system HicB family antitoxin [Desulfovibrionales bacterium]|nr:MAG: type II toxin-antitoxin system HicB family antitoxin [Desulfovibrionales bacterium]